MADDKKESGELVLVDTNQYCFHTTLLCKRTCFYQRLLCCAPGNSVLWFNRMEEKSKITIAVFPLFRIYSPFILQPL